MMIRQAIHEDTEGILALQQLYLFDNLSEAGRLQGFVTTPFTAQQIGFLINKKWLFVAEDQGRIVAYTMAGDWEFFSQWPIFPYMTSRFPMLKFKEVSITKENSFQYGPVCISIEYRGQGLLPRLFETMRKTMSKQFPIGVTFINQLNKRSYNAHVNKLNWEVVDAFQFNHKDFWGLAYDMQEVAIPDINLL